MDDNAVRCRATHETRVEGCVEDHPIREKGNLSVGGANLSGEAIEAGLVDEMHLFITPVAVGGGTPAHPAHLHSRIELLGFDRLARGVVHLHYRIIN